MAIILTLLLVFLLLIGSELWWRRKRPTGEFSRKFIHIFVGSLAAFWPFYISWNWILLLSLAFIIVVSISKYLHIFQAIHSVERPTWGEIFFAVAVGGLVFITHEPWIYAAALLHMSLADGLAAVVGVTWGKRSQYQVLGHPKSVVGSATFFLVAILILVGYGVVTGHPLGAGTLIGLALLTTGIENAGAAGLDNLFVPLVISAALTQL